MTRKKKHRSRMDESIRRCIAASKAYRDHSDSTRQREEAASDLGLDVQTFRQWENERAAWAG